jgi:hypothetical protein
MAPAGPCKACPNAAPAAAQAATQAAAIAGTQAPSGTPAPNGTSTSAAAAAAAAAAGSYQSLDYCFGFTKRDCCDAYNQLTDQSACSCFSVFGCRYSRQSQAPVVWRDNTFGTLCRC